MPSLTSYGSVTLLERVFLLRHLVLLPLHLLPILLVRLLLPWFSAYENYTWTRTLCMAVARYALFHFSVGQLQYLTGTSLYAYTAFAQSNDIPLVIDELGNDARLLWIGEKRTDRVILYVHGGGYVMGVGDYAMSFLRHYQLKLLREEGQKVGIAIMSYNPMPEGVFPKNLTQLQLGLAHLIDTEHILPGNIQLLGDSAGAHLIHQFVSQALHPHPSLPSYSLPSKLGGICFMSPALDMLGRSWETSDAALRQQFRGDGLPMDVVSAWGHMAFDDVPFDQMVYVDPMNLPAGWLDDIGKITSRWLITVGSEEALVVPVSEWYEKHMSVAAKRNEKLDIQLYVQDGGNHDDAMIGPLLGEASESNDVSQLTWQWFTEGVMREKHCW